MFVFNTKSSHGFTFCHTLQTLRNPNVFEDEIYIQASAKAWQSLGFTSCVVPQARLALKLDASGLSTNCEVQRTIPEIAARCGA